MVNSNQNECTLWGAGDGTKTNKEEGGFKTQESWVNVLFECLPGNISWKTNGIVSKNYYFNLMVSYLYSFNPLISINEIGKYLSRGIV